MSREPTTSDAIDSHAAVDDVCEAEPTTPVPTYTLRYTFNGEPVEHERSADGIESIGRVIMHIMAHGKPIIGNIAVIDASGGDVTFDFQCFCD